MNNIEPAGTRILYRDGSLCAVWKPSGVPTLPDRSGDEDLKSQVQALLKPPFLEPPHRLDRPVTGVVLFALDPIVIATLNEMFRGGSAQKRYWAIVHGHLGAPTELVHHLVHDARAHRARPALHGREVKSAVQPLAQGDRYTLVEVRPDGGAFHQIRAQLSLAGFPIKGDVKYGARRGMPSRGICLHARSLELPHPRSGASLCIQAAPPQEKLWQELAAGLA